MVIVALPSLDFFSYSNSDFPVPLHHHGYRHMSRMIGCPLSQFGGALVRVPIHHTSYFSHSATQPHLCGSTRTLRLVAGASSKKGFGSSTDSKTDDEYKKADSGKKSRKVRPVSSVPNQQERLEQAGPQYSVSRLQSELLPPTEEELAFAARLAGVKALKDAKAKELASQGPGLPGLTSLGQAPFLLGGPSTNAKNAGINRALPAAFDGSTDIYANPPSLAQTLMGSSSSSIADAKLRDAPIGPSQISLGVGAIVLVVIFLVVAGGEYATPSNRPSNVRPSTAPPDPIEAKLLRSRASTFEDQMRANPANVEALEGLAVTYTQLFEFAKAGDLLDKLAVQHPLDASVWRLLGETRMLTAQPAKAVSAYERALKLQPGDATIVSGLCNAYAANSAPSKAADLLLALRAAEAAGLAAPSPAAAEILPQSPAVEPLLSAPAADLPLQAPPISRLSQEIAAAVELPVESEVDIPGLLGAARTLSEAVAAAGEIPPEVNIPGLLAATFIEPPTSGSVERVASSLRLPAAAATAATTAAPIQSLTADVSIPASSPAPAANSLSPDILQSIAAAIATESLAPAATKEAAVVEPTVSLPASAASTVRKGTMADDAMAAVRAYFASGSTTAPDLSAAAVVPTTSSPALTAVPTAAGSGGAVKMLDLSAIKVAAAVPAPNEKLNYRMLEPVSRELLLAKIYNNWRGHDSDALAVYDNITRMYPEDYRGYLAKGMFMKEKGRKADADRMFLQARYYAPSNKQTLVKDLSGSNPVVELPE